MTKGALSPEPAGRELVITRVFDAPRQLVFRAWTDPTHVARWWGPKGFTNPVCELDARPGGAINIHMRGPDGVLYPMKGVFREIVEPERLVMITTAIEDEAGNPRLEVLTTVTFAEHDGKTKLTLRAVVVRAMPKAAAALAGMEEGWTQSLDRLAEHLGSVQGQTAKGDDGIDAQVGQRTRERNPALGRLDALVGAWHLEASVEGRPLGRGRTAFDWLEGGAFLVQHADAEPALPGTPAEWVANSPFPLASIIGLDDSSERFSMLYADARGVYRVYQMSLSDGVWKVWRDAPGFWQRFTGTFSDDGTTITGRWERSSDGENWEYDFDLTYRKVR